MKKIVLLLSMGLLLFSCHPEDNPSVSTGEVTNITATTATCAGNVFADGGAAIIARGICWSTSQFPTISDSKTSNGNGLGIFTSNITSLSPNTTYYVRAYATNSVGIAYGEQKTFTTNVEQTLPTVTTGDISNITTTTADCSGNVTSDGGSSVTARGVCWSTSENPTTSDSKTTNGTGLGTYTSNITGISPNTTYYVRAYATNAKGTAYGEQKTFTTNAEQTTPTVTTGEITNITTTTADCSGNVTSDGGSSVTARGVCWRTSENPTTSDSKTTDGTGVGDFTSNLTGLSPSTTYYVKAYATNSKGTAYGEQKSFKTNQEEEGTTFTDSRDGIVYETVTIGEQVWMAENLAYLPSVVGPATGSYTAPYYYVYGYDGTSVATAKATTNYQTYGVLYNWPAALTVCPPGWHLPSDEEWTELETYLANNGYNYDGSTGGDDIRAKIAISMASATGWDADNFAFAGTIGNTNAAYDAYRNKSGFTALPGGYRYVSGPFYRIGLSGYWWGSTQANSNYAWTRLLHYDSSYVYRAGTSKAYGFSVRCVRD
ncbi:MAG: FISUMP domain-containing protein [Sphaerochaetaceae bacterium]|nr:FISUMP domain-containing protein [Sphaerochaetaceae bacterium]MDD3945769.1 FISUMP domain-containing protein [Bacteroidales bacterium]